MRLTNHLIYVTKQIYIKFGNIYIVIYKRPFNKLINIIKDTFMVTYNQNIYFI
jgi:hypothetical protein